LHENSDLFSPEGREDLATSPPRGGKTSRRGAAALAAATVLLLAGCSSGGDEEGGGAAAGSAEPANGGKVDPGSAEARETIASQDVSTLGTDLHVAVHSLARGAKTVELTFSVTNTGDEASDSLWSAFARHAGSYDLSGVELVDTANGRLHLTATDDEGACVCSGNLNTVDLDPGDSLLLSATFGAPPEDVESLTVRIPTVGSFDNVPLG